jgi:hypothetical protein
MTRPQDERALLLFADMLDDGQLRWRAMKGKMKVRDKRVD